MQKLVTLIRTKYQIVTVAFLCTILGAATSTLMIAHAAIPDTVGTIHSCRNTTTTMLRVIDNASQNCDNNETSLDWDQKGVKAYAFFAYSNNTLTIDANRSYNVSDLYVNNPSFQHYDLCFTSAKTPENITVTPASITGGNGAVPYFVAIKDATGWTQSVGYNVCNSVAPNANVYMWVNGNSQFVTIF